MWKLRLDRYLSKSLMKQLLLLGVALLLALGLSYLFLFWSGAEWIEFCERKGLNRWLLPLYLLIDSNALNNLYIGDNYNDAVHGWMLFASTITFLIGAFVFNGIIIGIITATIERRVRNYEEGRSFYLKGGHHVIMGYDDMVPSIVSHIFETDPDANILILSSAEAQIIRERLRKSFSSAQMRKVIINYGHRVSEDIYGDINLASAKEIYVVGNHHKEAHDAINVECMDCIVRYLHKNPAKTLPRRITCVFKDLDTYAAFKTSDIFKGVEAMGIDFIPYNLYMGWAKQVFVKREYKDFDNPGVSYAYPSVYGNGVSPDDIRFVHLVFVGTGNYAMALATMAAQIIHLPNAHKRKTRITFIDRNMESEKEEFITRNRHLFEIQPYLYADLSENGLGIERICDEYVTFKGKDKEFLDIEFEFIKGDIFSKRVQDRIAEWSVSNGRTQFLSMFLPLSDQRQNFVMGMNMPDEVYANSVPLYIRQDRSDNLVTNLRNEDRKEPESQPEYVRVEEGSLIAEKCNARFANIYPFGMNETAYSVDNRSLARAKLINYLYETADYAHYKFKTVEELDRLPKEKLEGDAGNKWNRLTVALKWSNIYSAYSFRIKLEVLRKLRGLDINDSSHDTDPLSEREVEILAEMEHNRWNVEKLLMGFRKPKEPEDKYMHPEHSARLERNKRLFIHHDIRPFDQLDAVAELDREFVRYIPWIVKMTD